MAETEGYRVSYFFTSEKEVSGMKILMQSGIVQKLFTDTKEANKFISKMSKLTEKDSFFHYNFEEIQSVLLESRGKITRDNQIKDSIIPKKEISK